jgi:hypothetical protein
VGLDLNVTALLKVLWQRNFEIFEHLSHTTVHGWINRSGDKARWSDKTLARAEAENFQGHLNGGRRGILVRGTISTGGILALIRFSVSVSRCCRHYHGGLQNAGAPVTLITVRTLFIATIIDMAPQIFDTPFKDGSFFCASDSFIRKWLRETL